MCGKSDVSVILIYDVVVKQIKKTLQTVNAEINCMENTVENGCEVFSFYIENQIKKSKK